MNTLISIAPLQGDFLAHHGIKGQKWGVRRYQNPDGALTAAGRERYRSNINDPISLASSKILSDKNLKKEYVSLAANDRVAYNKWYFQYNTSESEAKKLKKETDDASNKLTNFLKKNIDQKYYDALMDEELKELVIMELDEAILSKTNSDIEKKAIELDKDYNNRDSMYLRYRQEQLGHSDAYLAHHQIKGAHWGILHGPPYPLARGKGPKKIKKASKEAIKRVEKQAEEGIPGAEKKKAELRKYIVEHPNKLYKHKEMFSREELEDIIKEIDFDRKLKDVKRNEFSRFVNDVRDVANLAISVKNITGSAVDIYKSANTIGDILAKRGEFAPKSEDKPKQESPKSESKPKTEDKPKQESSKSESKPKTEDKPKQESSKSDSKPKTEDKPKQESKKEPTDEEKKRRTAKGKTFMDSTFMLNWGL